ncbi:monofunctional biosynthetic peptidoglycan transglycosylase [Thiocystis violascens]|uniref:Biosynthetic peptidoglycan transglycosylase n=1 Tax=Thiocystis violascens (strain ATCC 17096 / DSM 198 / 6111) TaxID=765911 RepID=U3GKG2_THIV6|nr:monofunctional biosynthetic peptidoglycan transglycosylase [Thiocystis violascens]AFL72744.1 monofunctional biosynthetic peptidoglycan transglycosylase [Thiocystis violascens DSM 198]
MALVAGVLLLSMAAVLLLRWVNPPTSAVMATHWIASRVTSGNAPSVFHRWVDWELIPLPVALAAIAAEDQRFPTHRGFDLVEIRRALATFQDGGRLRGASTITQQTAKNLFLWSGRDYLRKGLEVWFTILLETFWSKQRILEVYLNIAQFSPDTYGVGAASGRYLGRHVSDLGFQDAALLAAVLPNPILYRLDAPSARVKRRAAWIGRQMRQLGGLEYLKRL